MKDMKKKHYKEGNVGVKKYDYVVNFLVDKETYQAFQAHCEARYTTVSMQLRKFIEESLANECVEQIEEGRDRYGT